MNNSLRNTLLAIIIPLLIIAFSTVIVYTVESRYIDTSYTRDAVSLHQELVVDVERALRHTVREGVVTPTKLHHYIRSHDSFVIGVSDRTYVRHGGPTLELFVTNPENMNLIRHEAFHIALLAAGFPEDQETQHRIMLENDWCSGGCFDALQNQYTNDNSTQDLRHTATFD